MTETERVAWIKEKLLEIKRIRVQEDDHIKSDEILYDLSDGGHLEWLIEHIELLKDALKGAAVITNRASEEIRELKHENERLKTVEQAYDAWRLAK